MKMDTANLQRLCIQTVRSVITAGIPADSQITIKGLINVIVNNTDVIFIDFNEEADGIANHVPQSPNNVNMGNARRSLVNSMGTPTRRPVGGGMRGMTPRTPRGMATRGRPVTPRGRGMTPRGRAISSRGGMLSPGMQNTASAPSMHGAINITPQPHITPQSGGVANGGVIEIDDDDGPVAVKSEPHHQNNQQQLNHLPPPQQHPHSQTFNNPNAPANPVKSEIPFADELGCRMHPKQEPGVNNVTAKRPNSSPMSQSPASKQQRSDSGNFGSDMMFKTEPQPGVGQSPQSQSVDAFKCPLCGKTFQFRSWFEKHLLGHENKGDLVSGACDGVVKQLISCRYCPKRFKYQTDLDNHMSSHIKESFKCNNCGMNYSSRKQLMDHMDREHQGATAAPATGKTLDAQALGLQ